MRIILNAGAVALVLAASAASAHMPYLLPSVFDAQDRTSVTLEASFTEEAFRPDITMRDAPFEVTTPDGSSKRLPDATIIGDRAISVAELPAAGTYRLSTGQRLGRTGKMYKSGQDWKIVGEGAAAPEGNTLVEVQSTTLADAYVTRGAPSAGALAPRGKALEIHPLANPADATAKTAFPIEILYDGKPLSGASVAVFREAGFYDGRKTLGDFAADKRGKLSVTLPDAGRYLLLVRHRTAAPKASPVPYLSYTVTLAIEAM